MRGGERGRERGHQRSVDPPPASKAVSSASAPAWRRPLSCRTSRGRRPAYRGGHAYIIHTCVETCVHVSSIVRRDGQVIIKRLNTERQHRYIRREAASIHTQRGSINTYAERDAHLRLQNRQQERQSSPRTKAAVSGQGMCICV